VVLAGVGAAPVPGYDLASTTQGVLQSISVGTVRTANNAPVFLAQARGYFQEQGIDVRLEYFDSGVNIVPALATNRVDIGEGSLTPALLNAYTRGVNLRIVAQKASGAPGADYFPIMIRKDLWDNGTFTRYSDITGRRVAVSNLWTGSHYKLVKLDARFGISNNAYEIQTLPFGDMTAALQNRAIDAAVVVEPVATRLELNDLAVRLMGEENSPEILVQVYSYAEAFMRERPALGRAFLVGWLRGVREFTMARSQGGAVWENVRAVLAGEIPELADTALAGRMAFAYMDPNGRIPPEQYAELVDWYQAAGQLTRRVELAELYEPSFLQGALATIGEARP
jgi:NitT/TauT family transport system substrate-binding protein